MALRAYLLAFAVAALLNATQATVGHSASNYAWRQCWVTETGLGVCVPSPPVSLRRQRALIAPRH
jgi:hypothetical protein